MIYEDTQVFRKILKGAFFFLIGTVFAKLARYGFNLILARLGPEKFGAINIALILVSIVSVISTLGLADGVLRFIPFYKGENNKKKLKNTFHLALTTSLYLGILMGFLIYMFSGIIANEIFNNSELQNILKILSFGIPFCALNMVLLAHHQAFKRVKIQVFVYNFTENIGKLAVVLFVFLTGMDLLNIPLGFNLVFLSSTIIYIVVLEYKVFPFFREKSEKVFWDKDLFDYSYPLLFNGIMNFIIFWTDIILIGALLSVYDSGIYNSCLLISSFILFAPELLLPIFLPTITELYASNNIKNVESTFKITAKWIQIASIFLFTVVLFLAKKLLVGFFGVTYSIGAEALVILAFGKTFLALSATPLRAILMMGKSRIVFYTTALCAGLNLLLNFILIPKYGIEGGAIATSIALIIPVISYHYYTHKLLKLFPFNLKTILIFISAIIPGLILKFFNPIRLNGWINIFIQGTLYFILFCVLLFLFRIFDENDRIIFKSISNFLKNKKNNNSFFT
ncbi:flippase [bacterium]|nr:flippase [bacterium]